MTRVDFIVIGAGIAGAGVAYELSRTASVLVLEAETQPGQHSTGRSAALFSEIYGNEPVRALTRASRLFLAEPPADFSEGTLLVPRGSMFVATREQAETFEDLCAQPDVGSHTRRVDTDDALARVPILRREHAAHALLEEHAQDIDVHGVHRGFLRGLKRNGGTLVTGDRVESIARNAVAWEVVAGAQRYHAPVIVNAAGAWADEVAALAGIARIGLEPRRRTALIVDLPNGIDPRAWPMVIDVADAFYFKPDAGRLLLSPADETPSPPVDAMPDDLDVALAVERFEQATTVTVSRVPSSWAGLRTFAPDRSPIAGFDPSIAGFFWLAGQGGYGIQTAPALSRLAAALALGNEVPQDIADHGVDAETLSPRRLR